MLISEDKKFRISWWKYNSPMVREEVVFAENFAEIKIGRSEECNIVLAGSKARDYVSNLHAKIQHIHNRYFVRDCESMNGTVIFRVSEGQVPEEINLHGAITRLRDKDILIIGDFALQIDNPLDCNENRKTTKGTDPIPERLRRAIYLTIKPTLQAKIPTTAFIRKFLEHMLPTSSDFNAFVLDNYRQIYIKFSDGMDRVARTTLLLESIRPERRHSLLMELKDIDEESFAIYINIKAIELEYE